MRSRFETALSSNNLLLFITVWKWQLLWNWGCKMKPTLLRLPPQTAWIKAMLSSKEIAPKRAWGNDDMYPPKVSYWHPLRPTKARFGQSVQSSTMIVSLRNYFQKAKHEIQCYGLVFNANKCLVFNANKVRWRSKLCLFLHNVTLGQRDCSVGQKLMWSFHHLRHFLDTIRAAILEVHDIQTALERKETKVWLFIFQKHALRDVDQHTLATCTDIIQKSFWPAGLQTNGT